MRSCNTLLLLLLAIYRVSTLHLREESSAGLKGLSVVKPEPETDDDLTVDNLNEKKENDPKDEIKDERVERQVVWKCPEGPIKLEKMAVGCSALNAFAYHCATFATYTLTPEDGTPRGKDNPGKYVLMIELLGDYYTNDAVVYCDTKHVPEEKLEETKQNLEEYVKWGKQLTVLTFARINDWFIEDAWDGGGWSPVLESFNTKGTLPDYDERPTLTGLKGWIKSFLRIHEKYEVLRDNCQKFASHSYRAGTGVDYHVKQCAGAFLTRLFVGPDANNGLSKTFQWSVQKSMESKRAIKREIDNRRLARAMQN
uniref:LRAT domain-containing protein n=1 Tax=Chromera velia CCMP2878 TaxID=1169474 RepID=A0A0K6S9S3_9ALVE|eukprot:Cvel_7990.t3-p1 / transcript=Cvel_7990.t3 / gene=Cvel_7990 / organism=Chromera_velia_CCMP2878 / gene_product=hypothetical protein / transcript_product=hypothetical protein / location=Cvel_scaffold430:60161-61090(-) / protein_length=310 / sequence_SO=supercontig / SO=protein_coding / is_pseudo=false